MNIPEELLPLVAWWQKDGKQTVIALAVVGAAILAWNGYKNYREVRRVDAGSALISANGVEELEEAVSKYGSTEAGAGLKLKLAKAYYDAANYSGAADLYAELDGKAPVGFEDVPALGVAECLEAQEKYGEAAKAYADFIEAKAASPFVLEAKFGAARVKAAAGDRDGAVKDLEAVKATFKDDAGKTALVDAAIDVVKRWEKRSIFDAAAQVADTLKAAEAEAPKAEAPAPDAPAAAEAPAAEAK